MVTFTIMGRRCTHMIIVADVTCPILGIDVFSDGDGKVFVIDAATDASGTGTRFVQQMDPSEKRQYIQS